MIKHRWGREYCIAFCSRNEINELVWMKAAILKLTEIARRFGKGTSPPPINVKQKCQAYIVQLPRNKKK
jgi:hypothetical protein